MDVKREFEDQLGGDGQTWFDVPIINPGNPEPRNYIKQENPEDTSLNFECPATCITAIKPETDLQLIHIKREFVEAVQPLYDEDSQPGCSYSDETPIHYNSTQFATARNKCDDLLVGMNLDTAIKSNDPSKHASVSKESQDRMIQYSEVTIDGQNIKEESQLPKVVLKRHKRSQVGEKSYACDVCLLPFTRIANLKKHKMKHTGEKPFQCDECLTKFTQRCSLKKHKMIHTGEKPYECNLCSYKCSDSDVLERHKRKHTGEKPYECDVCQLTFSQIANLKTHKMRHTGEKPYQCEECSAKFLHRCSLKRHKITHTGEKPYKCDVCSFKCTRLSNLKIHKNTHTG